MNKKQIRILLALSTLSLVTILAGCCGPAQAKPAPTPGSTPNPAPGGTATPSSAIPLANPVVYPVANPASASVSAGYAPNTTVSDAAADGSVELKTEECNLTKAVVPNGQVVLRKKVVSEVVTMPVVLSHDEYVLDHVGNTTQAATKTAFGTYDIVIPLTKETASCSAVPKLLDIVRLRKVVVQETNVLSCTVRTEQAEVVRAP